MGFQFVTTCTNSGLRVDGAIRVGRANTEVIVGHQVWEVCIDPFQLHDDLAFTIRRDLLHLRNDTFGSRIRVCTQVMLDRGNHIVGFQ